MSPRRRTHGDQPINVRGVTAVASRTRREQLAVTVGRVLVHLEGRNALRAWTNEFVQAEMGGPPRTTGAAHLARLLTTSCSSVLTGPGSSHPDVTYTPDAEDHHVRDHEP